MRLAYNIRRFAFEVCFITSPTLTLQGRQLTPRLSIPVPSWRSSQYSLKPPKLSSVGWFTTSRSFAHFKRRLQKRFVATTVSGKKASERISLLGDNYVKSQETGNPEEQGNAHPGTPHTSWNALEPKIVFQEASTTGSCPASQYTGDVNRQLESEKISGILAQAADPDATKDSHHCDRTFTMPTDARDSLKLSLHGRDSPLSGVNNDSPSRSTNIIVVHQSSLKQATTAEELRGIVSKEALFLRDREMQDDTVARKSSPQSSIPVNRPENPALSPSLPAVPLETMTTTVGSKKGISVAAAAAAALKGLRRGHRKQTEDEGLGPGLKHEDRTANPAMLASVTPLKDKLPGPAVRMVLGVFIAIIFAAVQINGSTALEDLQIRRGIH